MHFLKKSKSQECVVAPKNTNQQSEDTNGLILKSSLLYRFFKENHKNFFQISITPQKIFLNKYGSRTKINIKNVLDFKVSSMFFLYSKVFIKTRKNEYTINFLKIKDAKNLESLIFYLKDYHLIKADYDLLSQVCDSIKYISLSENKDILDKIKNSPIVKYKVSFFKDLEKELKINIAKLKKYLANPESIRQKNNSLFVKKELDECKKFFDEVESNPLTERQRLSVVTDEDNDLIVAGAGSGKTSVIIAKILYLLKKKLARPEEILVLAYNKKAQLEISERLATKTDLSPNIMTFHGLGFNILKCGSQRKVVSVFATDDLKYKNFIRKTIGQNIETNSKYAELIITYFQEYFYPAPDIENFQQVGDYYNYLKGYEIRSLGGEKVKSWEEYKIANFLFFNNIKYEYEKAYPHDDGDRNYKTYQPDFYLPEYDIYIEHFGIDKNGKTAPYIDSVKYNDSIKWKREIHKKYKTKLVETYSYENIDDVLLSNLREKLEKYNVVFNPIDSKKIFEILDEKSEMDSFSDLVATFLNHFKSNQLTIEMIREKIEKNSKMELSWKSIYEHFFERYKIKRLKAFVDVFEPIYLEYSRYLEEHNEIDFNDMIVTATKYHKDGIYKSPYKYILVDEFQDISNGRALLVKELLNEDRIVKLFCVGDDWQSIYRFAGSDISIMRNFADHFGFTERIDLDLTFRFDNQINDVATKFITQNPAQLVKEIKTFKQSENPSVIIYHQEKQRNNNDDSINEEDCLNVIFREIASNLKEKTKNSVLILSRFNKLYGKNSKSEEFRIRFEGYKRNFPDLNFATSSVHGSKGLGYDYVVLIDANRGAFPLEKIDDPILDIVLAEKEDFPNAEERRLFYVALTRAKERVYIVSDGTPSPFIEELENSENEYNVGIVATNDNPRNIHCPVCGTGLLIKSNSKKSFICSHYGYCDYMTAVCDECHNGLVVKDENGHMCCSVCDSHKERCPNCDDGFLVKRKGKSGNFYGCSNFPRCTYTKSIGRNYSKTSFFYKKSYR